MPRYTAQIFIEIDATDATEASEAAEVIRAYAERMQGIESVSFALTDEDDEG